MIPTWSPLNWKELEQAVAALRPRIQGLFVDRIIVPERPRFPGGYVKGEWAIRLGGKARDCCLIFSVRPRRPFLLLTDGRGPKAASDGTHSAFDLALSKHLRGARVLDIGVFPRERAVCIRFSGPTAQEEFGLILSLIPATPEALLVQIQGQDGSNEPPWPILARSRVIPASSQSKVISLYQPPDGSRAPESPPVREELVRSPELMEGAISRLLEEEAFELRLRQAQKNLKDLSKLARERARQSETAIAEAENELDWQRLGELLKANLGNLSIEKSEKGASVYRVPDYQVTDYESENWVDIPADPRRTPSEEVERFFSLARRKRRRISEAGLRLSDALARLKRTEELLAQSPPLRDWKELEKLEIAGGITPSQPGAQASRASGGVAARVAAGVASGVGRSFLSKDGWRIFVGRNRTENLELTFRYARGNDLWMHVRGKPGAHVIIPVQPGKSVPLETLLDAAALAIHYSGGQSWGKTEVDYTFKKHVKRIKDSTEASYTQNKTLIIAPDPERLRSVLGRALGAGDGVDPEKSGTSTKVGAK